MLPDHLPPPEDGQEQISEARQRRRAAVLASFSHMPPGMSMTSFCRSIQLDTGTLYQWMQDPKFRAQYQEVMRARETIDLMPLREVLNDIMRTVRDKALTGDIGALRLACDVLGLTGKNAVNVNVNAIIAAQQINIGETADDLSDDELEKLLERHRTLGGLIGRERERLRIVAQPAGPDGPAPDAGGTAPQP